LPVPFARVKPGKFVAQERAFAARGDSLSGFTRTGEQVPDDMMWPVNHFVL
jgi:hypothetical protein